jgi:hypothetical protein
VDAGTWGFWGLTEKGVQVLASRYHLARRRFESSITVDRVSKDNPLHDGDRFMLAVSQIAGKRLTYAVLTGKVGETKTF